MFQEGGFHDNFRLVMIFKCLISIALSILTVCHLQSQSSGKMVPDEDIYQIRKRGYSVDACYRMAEDFIRTGTEYLRALPYLEHIFEKEPSPHPKVYHLFARALYYSGHFDRAVLMLNQYIEKEKDKYLLKLARADKEQYLIAAKIASVPVNAILVNLGPNINSQYAEINPYISKNEDLLVYSSNRSKSFNIYVSKKPDNESLWSVSKLAGKFINTMNDEFVAGLSPSGKNLMVHYNQVSGFEDINISSRSHGLYRELFDPGQTINSSYREEGACMTEDGDTLFFASDRPGGHGGFDLYYSLRLPDGEFGQPINMGESVNTKGDENYPNLSPDRKKLYFASNGHPGIGAYDIFFTSFDQENGKWTSPINLGYPINNAFDNKNIAFSGDSRYAYISTIAKPGYGDYDIFKVIFLDFEPSCLIIRTEVFTKDNAAEPVALDANFQAEMTVYQGNEVFGRYAYDKRNKSFILALIPGTFILELNAEGYSIVRKKITIDENHYKNKMRILKIVLEKKSQELENITD